MSDNNRWLDYDEDELFKFVERRVGDENYSGTWDYYSRKSLIGRTGRKGARVARARHANATKHKGGIGSGKGPGGGGGSPTGRLRTSLAARHGQAVVKVLSYGRDRTSVKAQVNYVGRRGWVELETRDGDTLKAVPDVNAYLEDWAIDYDTKANSRNSLHMQISVREGINRESAHKAVRAFAKDVFGSNHEYVLARHDDTAHPHTHIIVKMRGDDGTKLDPKKADLQYWREAYAFHARKYGIILDASPRRTRGQGRKGEKMATRKAKERGEVSRAEAATALEVFADPQADHPADDAAATAFEGERREFAKLGLALKDLAESEASDRETLVAMLQRVHAHAKGMPEPKSLRKELQALMLARRPPTSPEELLGRYRQLVEVRRAGRTVENDVQERPSRPNLEGRDEQR